MILLWKTKQDSGTEEGDVSRLMTCFIDMKNVFFSAWDCPVSWLASEWLMFQRMSILSCRLWLHLVLIVGFFHSSATYFPQRPVKHFLSPTSCPTHASVPVYFSCLNSKDSYLLGRKPNRRKWETPGLQTWARSGICPIRCSGTGLLWGTFEETRQIWHNSQRGWCFTMINRKISVSK